MFLFVKIFVIAFLAAVVFTNFAKKIAWRHKVLDLPGTDPARKVHRDPKPLLGGLGVILAFDLVSLFLYQTEPILRQNIPFNSMLAIWLGSIVLAVGGILDDAKNLKPYQQIIFPLIAVLLVVFSGMEVPHISNPFGGKISLAGFEVAGISVIGAAFIFAWLLGMIYTSKFLDGLDGLDGSISFVAALSLFALSFTPQVMQPYTAILAIALAGAVFGFLIFNWYPSRIFLGESGSTFLGFILGILAIISGGKVATAFLVMGVPILDVAWVILRRIFSGQSPFKADRLHLHFRLLDLGLSHKQTVGIFVLFSAVFGGTAVLLQSFGKFLSVLILLVVMLCFGLFVVYLSRRRQIKAGLTGR
ncbi:MAG: hypothetical protein A3J48_00455 [Candidatus Doudnabacteria bacterium RIFCSPHIGHO2_02_FULL_46_11]|uniref:Undecaprenyl-phosphate alpha-N-acetylglucosaminyl 1-phosphate transferase n=1 Tax=Candidatus Doudnabacteria bacterium RIFCSPHIGHO2_02_FULL_46_11 TaxID=1817832 RepID=A0A1F5P516_9BACT|nr:MAG: hypothetical protein A3J48_00455 [Candidatus Doudnabacteria bacterium RIFCSPHIGHO2_02_FULL_46_11]